MIENLRNSFNFDLPTLATFSRSIKHLKFLPFPATLEMMNPEIKQSYSEAAVLDSEDNSNSRLYFRRNCKAASWEVAKDFFIPFLIPTCLTVYAMVSMNSRNRLAGLVDHALFSLSFAIAYGFIFALPRLLWRGAASFVFVVGAAMFFLFVNLNFRFLHSWGQLDALEQWEDVFVVWKGITSLMKPQDILYGLFIPLGLWKTSLSTSGIFSRKARRPLILLSIALFLVQYKLTDGRPSYADQNPFFYMVRQKYFQLQLKYSQVFRGRGGHLFFKPSDYVQVNPSLFTLTKNKNFPFLKLPVRIAPALPFAINTNPNVVLILMESVRAFESGIYGSTPSYTPELDRLAREGVLFTKFYANGAQTIRAEFAIHSSYVPNMRGGQVFIDQPNVGIKTLGMIFKKKGYSTHWFGSHPPSFDNKIKFHSSHGIDSFHYDFKQTEPHIGMGPADVDLMNHALDILTHEKHPYFAEIMTLSNHYPFAIYPTDPQSPPVAGSDIYQKYVHGIYYTDSVLGSFFEKVRANHAFDNTVFIVTGDHGIWTYPDTPRFDGMVMRQEAFFRVPLVFWSPKLIDHRRVDQLGSHIDIMPTLLDLLNIRIPNAFLGSSLFRNDLPLKFVIMNHDTRWNLRLGNDYVYDTGPESFLSHYPLGDTPELEKIFNKDGFNHLYFNSKQDLFQKIELGETTIIPSERRLHLEIFAEEAMNTFDRALLSDRIYPHSVRDE